MHYKIGDVAREAKVPEKWARNLYTEGLLPPPSLSPGGKGKPRGLSQFDAIGLIIAGGLYHLGISSRVFPLVVPPLSVEVWNLLSVMGPEQMDGPRKPSALKYSKDRLPCLYWDYKKGELAFDSGDDKPRPFEGVSIVFNPVELSIKVYQALIGLTPMGVSEDEIKEIWNSMIQFNANARAIQDKADAEGRLLTDDEAQRIGSCLDGFDRLAKRLTFLKPNWCEEQKS